MIDIGKDLQAAFDDGYAARDKEIVRCRECKHHEVFKNGVNGWCNGHGCPADVTYFCADGERKTMKQN